MKTIDRVRLASLMVREQKKFVVERPRSGFGTCFRIFDNPGVGPLMTTRAFLSTNPKDEPITSGLPGRYCPVFNAPSGGGRVSIVA